MLGDWLLANDPSGILLQNLNMHEYRYNHLSVLSVGGHQPQQILICGSLVTFQYSDMSRILLIWVTILLQSSESV